MKNSYNYFQHENLLELLEKISTQHRPRWFFYSENHPVFALSGATLHSYSYQQALGIRKKFPDQYVFISLPNSAEFLISFFAILIAGKTPVPVSCGETSQQEEYSRSLIAFSQCVGSRQVITTVQNKTLCESLGFKVLNMNLNTAKGPVGDLNHRNQYPGIKPQDCAFIQFSSGTTSDPKGIILSHRALLTNLAQIREGLKVCQTDVLISWLPFYHDMGLIGALFGCLYNDVEGHFYTPLHFLMKTEEWMRKVEEVKASVLLGPDFMYRMLAKKASSLSDVLDWSSIRACLTGSEPISQESCQYFVDALSKFQMNKNVVMPVYGMAEASLAISFRYPGAPLHSQFLQREDLAKGFFTPQRKGNVQAVSCGRPLQGIEIKVFDEFGVEVSEGCIGEIAFKSESMTSGFLNSQNEFEKRMKNGFYLTGDLGCVFNSELYITGRKKDLIIMNGRKFYSIDLENLIYKKMSFLVSRISVIGLKEPHSVSEKICVVLEVKELNYLIKNVLKNFVQQSLSPLPVKTEDIFIVPRKVLPRTSSGKIKRFAIRKMAENGKLHSLQKYFFYHALKNKVQMFKYLSERVKNVK